MSRLYPIVHHMHEVLRLHASDETSIQTSIRQYVIALAGHLETYFRDIFRFALEQDASFFDRIIQAHCIRLPAEHALEHEGITRYDFISEALTLQSAGSVAGALDPLFLPDGFQAAVENTRLVYAVPSRSALGHGFPLSAFPNWWKDFTQLFELRHELVHDANTRYCVEGSHIARLESLAVVLPQYVTLMVLTNGHPETINKADATPAILLVEDFLATDWEAVS
ncbi:hypothetical protein AOX56_00025 [Aeromonas sobria]|uniref:Cthe-2314-like HEPN domain-containing protein n=2 Tax=Aeromonadaceae TaxID=84642 RepID=A0A2N3J8Q1_AERSO|nr:hypothetical protein AOX56_00025 [Aeromonas sobria]